MGLKVIAQYALFGQWDFLNIIEAPDEATMAKAAVTLAARGTMRSTTLQALPIEELLEALRERARARRRSDPPHVVLAPLFADLVVVEQHGQHRAVGAAPHPVAAAPRPAVTCSTTSKPRAHALVEARAHLDAGPGLHRPIVNRGAQGRSRVTAARPVANVARVTAVVPRPTLRLERQVLEGRRAARLRDRRGRPRRVGRTGDGGRGDPCPRAPARACATRRC